MMAFAPSGHDALAERHPELLAALPQAFRLGFTILLTRLLTVSGARAQA